MEKPEAEGPPITTRDHTFADKAMDEGLNLFAKAQNMPVGKARNQI